MTELFANREDPDQTPRSAASDLGLHCLPNTLSGGLQTIMGEKESTLKGTNPFV